MSWTSGRGERGPVRSRSRCSPGRPNRSLSWSTASNRGREIGTTPSSASPVTRMGAVRR